MYKQYLFVCLLLALAVCEGGYQNVKIKEFMSQNNEIFTHINEILDDEAGPEYFLWKIESVQQQIVSGINYKMVVDYQKKDDPNQLSQQFNLRPWTNTRKVTSMESKNLRVDNKKSSNFKYHGWVDLDAQQFNTKYPQIQTLLLSKLIPKFDLEDNTSIMEIQSVKEQFIAGKTYLIFVQLSDGKKYKGTLYENPWSKKMEVVTVELEEEE
ncbi:unnamed protein product (macronuclear) [Paramecium tetraurelia]|uniref:Cystatin domain-containing protein n=1 Tax=Paramecium tetraurelia TaxID=5888 RepID=A0E043_PARTE|nr:uncharacterized protein GSPATT00021828001 [Paramecium tetraurelia]CAK88660.1 unnamed protein product [Paramecium tetraurelia]|eukprot:XP_001456057.1 hypothetical protein (macronuclear) [Paramecium tetraurelia strain d4-2]